MSGLIRIGDLVREGGPDRSVRRSAERGDVARLARGRYLTAPEWASLDPDTRYCARVHAFAETTRTTQVFSHWSAAALWGYPVIGAWPNRIHLTFNPGTGQRGVRRLRSVADFADGRSGSPGESLSRVQAFRLRLPKPDLQVEVVDLDGRVWHTDFGWPGSRLFGEFDGLVKYTRNRYLEVRDVADVVIQEKRREDAIRLVSGFSMVRWTWSVASDLNQLQRLLAGAVLRAAVAARNGHHPESDTPGLQQMPGCGRLF